MSWHDGIINHLSHESHPFPDLSLELPSQPAGAATPTQISCSWKQFALAQAMPIGNFSNQNLP